MLAVALVVVAASVALVFFLLPKPPNVNAIHPTSGPVQGGINVVIQGSGFKDVKSVSFDGKSASSFTVVSDTQITAISPPGSGTIDVTVTTSGGTSATSSATKFTHIAGVLSHWQSGTSMPTPRSELAAVLGPDGRIYAIGGGSGGLIDTVEAYDPKTDRWSPVASMLTPRTGLAAVLGPDGRIYTIGGGYGSILDTVEAYDPKTNRWSPVASMSTPRTNLAAVLGPDGRIYAIGGSFSDSILDTVEAYDPKTNRWSPVASMSTPRTDLAAVFGTRRPHLCYWWQQRQRHSRYGRGLRPQDQQVEPCGLHVDPSLRPGSGAGTRWPHLCYWWLVQRQHHQNGRGLRPQDQQVEPCGLHVDPSHRPGSGVGTRWPHLCYWWQQRQRPYQYSGDWIR